MGALHVPAASFTTILPKAALVCPLGVQPNSQRLHTIRRNGKDLIQNRIRNEDNTHCASCSPPQALNSLCGTSFSSAPIGSGLSTPSSLYSSSSPLSSPERLAVVYLQCSKRICIIRSGTYINDVSKHFARVHIHECKCIYLVVYLLSRMHTHTHTHTHSLSLSLSLSFSPTSNAMARFFVESKR